MTAVVRAAAQLVQSLEWAVQQRESARSEAEGIGAALAASVVEMQRELDRVLSVLDSEVRGYELQLQKALLEIAGDV